jgi:hypothetical protein
MLPSKKYVWNLSCKDCMISRDADKDTFCNLELVRTSETAMVRFLICMTGGHNGHFLKSALHEGIELIDVLVALSTLNSELQKLVLGCAESSQKSSNTGEKLLVISSSLNSGLIFSYKVLWMCSRSSHLGCDHP